MSGHTFHFQQFDVRHDRCSMKVGTDGVLLGAWTEVPDAGRILDVGTGSGLVALILAQRSKAGLVGIELDASAAQQAGENFGSSPWADRLVAVCQDFRRFEDGKFDLLVSNPPFFRNALKAPAIGRNLARHDDTLPYEALVSGANRMLHPTGRLAVILPLENAPLFEDLCWQHGLFLHRRCEVTTVEGKLPKRVLMEFSRSRGVPERTNLALETPEHCRTAAFMALTAGLYLNQ